MEYYSFLYKNKFYTTGFSFFPSPYGVSFIIMLKFKKDTLEVKFLVSVSLQSIIHSYKKHLTQIK